MRTWTHKDGSSTRTWSGFNRDFSPIKLEHVAMFMVEGELEVWALDDPQTTGGLMNYLADRDDSDHIVPLGVYSR